MLGRNPQAWSGLKACRGRGYIAFPVIAPKLGCDRGSPKEHTFPALSPRSDFAASKHYASVAQLLERGRIGATLRECHFPAKMVQNGARRASGIHTVPLPRIFFSSYFLQHTFVLCMAGLAGLSMWGKSKFAVFGGGPMVGTTSTKVTMMGGCSKQLRTCWGS